jgi:hypothetical protein
MGESLERQEKSDIRRWPCEIQSSNFRNLDIGKQRHWRGNTAIHQFTKMIV